jgi:hypothetical protein
MIDIQNKRSVDGFLKGLAAGALGSLIGSGALLYVLSRTQFVSFSNGYTPDVSHWFDWAYANLGTSILVFTMLLVAFTLSLAQLRKKLESDAPTNEIVQLDHMTDIWMTLFFGTGVIWTAIGMRSALLFALGDPESTLQQGAFAILQRMVDGGILLALSTTIFGGVGGYLMRVYKSVTLGSLLQQHYDRAARLDTSSMSNTLERIEKHLKDQGPTEQDVPADNNE